MKTIIVPTDLSDTSKNSAYYAADMAVALNMNILLLNAVTIPVSVSAVSVPAEEIDMIIEEAKTEMADFKNRLTDYTHGKVNVSISIETGRVIDELEQAAQQADVFAIVMGMQGAGAASRALFGSTALAAMRLLSCPVIIVPRGSTFQGIKKMGMACDMQDVTEKTPLKKIEDIVKQLSCSLDILYVSNDNGEMDKERQADAKTLLNSMADIQPKFHFIRSGHIEACVLDFVRLENIDLLLVIPREHGFSGTIFHKSVSKQIALHCHIPILTLHGA